MYRLQHAHAFLINVTHIIPELLQLLFPRRRRYAPP
jgi:hypothetical protein